MNTLPSLIQARKPECHDPRPEDDAASAGFQTALDGLHVTSLEGYSTAEREAFERGYRLGLKERLASAA